MDYFNHQPPGRRILSRVGAHPGHPKDSTPFRIGKTSVFQQSSVGNIRAIIEDNGNPMFCLTDLRKALDLNPSKVAQRLTEDVLAKRLLETAGRTQQANLVNEDGLMTRSSTAASQIPISKVIAELPDGS